MWVVVRNRMDFKISTNLLDLIMEPSEVLEVAKAASCSGKVVNVVPLSGLGSIVSMPIWSILYNNLISICSNIPQDGIEFTPNDNELHRSRYLIQPTTKIGHFLQTL
jgi:hypothetical protein